MVVNILTLKWGTKYGPEYVNYLYAGVQNHLSLDFRFLCFTDDPRGLCSGVEIYPLPDLDVPPAWRYTPWLKLALFRDGLADLSGTTLFFDIDMVIIGQLDDLFTWEPSRRCIIKDWEWPHQRLLRRHGISGNSSVFRFEAGDSQDVLDRFIAERDEVLGRYRRLVDQRYLTESLSGHLWWPKKWIVSFKRHCLPNFPINLFRIPSVPQDARIVVFHGHPNPHEALAGYYSYKPHRITLPTPWIKRHWGNSEPS